MTIKIILKIDNSWTELSNFQNSFNCYLLELLRTAPLPIHKVIMIAMFLDGMNAIYLYFVNKLCLDGRYWDFKIQIDIKKIVEKGEIALFEQFHLFQRCFPKVFFFKV